MADYEVRFNVLGSGSYTDAETGETDTSVSGHMNVSFVDNSSGFSVTQYVTGANQDALGKGLGFIGYANTADGIIKPESSLLESHDRLIVSRSVPVTKKQFEALAAYAESIEGQRYDYALLDGPNGYSQHCADYANEIYVATGHPGVVGDLFSMSDIDKVPGPIWIAIGVNTYGIPVYLPTGPIEDHVVDTSDILPEHCFFSGTPISMWPSGYSLAVQSDGSYNADEVLSEAWSKPISEIKADDLVLSYDAQGRLMPGRVTRTFQNEVIHVLDFWGTGVTPGHAYLCTDGKFEGRHVPLMDILRTDGAIM